MSENEENKYIIDNTDEKNIIRYEKIRRIDKGYSAACYLLKCLQDNKYYVGKFKPKNKEINLSDSQKYLFEQITQKNKKDLDSERKIHQELNHPNIVKFHKAFEDNKNLYLIIDYCSKGDLNNLLEEKKNLKEIEVQYYMKELINALKYLHDRNIIHRDLKLGNIFLNEKSELKLGDFGFSIKLKQGEENIRDIPCGTPDYMAPEIIEGNHSKKSDIWALGIIMYKLLFGKFPFVIKKESLKRDVEKLKNMEINDKQDNIKISEITFDLIRQLLEFDFKKRPSLDSILKHDFFRAEEDNEGNFNVKEKEQEEKIEDENKIDNEIKEKNLIGVNIWIEDYFDFDNYNHCIYLLNNGYYGIFFDKNKNILLNPNDPKIIYYIENNLKKEYNIAEIPSNLKEEIDCFNCLKDKLNPYNDLIINQEKNNFDIYIRKFMEEGNATFFWLSNNDMQVFFFEKYKRSEILYCKEKKVITYVNFEKRKFNYSIESLKTREINNPDFNKKFKLVTDTLYNMREKIKSKNK